MDVHPVGNCLCFPLADCLINHKCHGDGEQGLIIHHPLNRIILGHQGEQRQKRDLGEELVHGHSQAPPLLSHSRS